MGDHDPVYAAAWSESKQFVTVEDQPGQDLNTSEESPWVRKNNSRGWRASPEDEFR
jgi:hypothetical protein